MAQMYPTPVGEEDLRENILEQAQDAPVAPPQAVEPDDVISRAIAKERERKEKQRALYDKHTQDVAKLDEERKRKAAEVLEQGIQAKQEDLEKRRALAKKAGIDEDEIEARLADVQAEIEKKKGELAKYKVGLSSNEPEIEPLATRKAAGEDIQPAGMSDALYRPEEGIRPQERGAAQGELVSDQVPGLQRVDPMAAATDYISQPYEMQKEAINFQAQIGASKAAEQLAAEEKIAREDKNRILAMEKERKANADFIQDRMNVLDAKAKDLSTRQIDPDRYWANKSTGDKVLAGIGLFLGAFGGNGNQAARRINEQIEQDIRVQQANIDTERQGLQQERGLLSELRSVFNDNDAARQATRVAYLDNAKLKLQQIASKYGGKEIQAKAMELMAGIEAQKRDAVVKFRQEMAKNVPYQEGMSPELMSEDKRERYVPGWGLALTKEGAEKFRSRVANVNAAKTGLNELLDITNMTGKSLNPEIRSRATTLADFLKGQLRTELVGPGAVSDSERAILDRIIANPSEVTRLDVKTRASLQAVLDRLTNAVDEEAKLRGLKSISTRIGFTPEG